MTTRELIKTYEDGIEQGTFASFTEDSKALLDQAYEIAKSAASDMFLAKAGLQAAFDGLETAQKTEPETPSGTLTCNVKSLMAKVGKPQQSPVGWDGAGTLLFTTSNAAICNVTDAGLLVPMKPGTAIITIMAPNGQKVLLPVTVTA